MKAAGNRIALGAVAGLLTMCTATGGAAANVDVPDPYTALSASPAACNGALTELKHQSRVRTRRALACLISNERRIRGLSPLRSEQRLTKAGRRYARKMVAKGFFAHIEPDGRRLGDRVRASGYPHGRPWLVLENLIAIPAGPGVTPAWLVHRWMGSRSHRENLLDPWMRDLGLGLAGGYATHGGPGITAVALLGRRGIVIRR